MANENIQGAPASGFSQTVSFAADPRQASVPKTGAAGAQGDYRGGTQGGVDTRANPMNRLDAPRENPTLALLQQIGGQYLQAKVKEARAEAFVTGMQRAASGEAIKDIADGQPWYTSIFGESDVVEGARQYTGQARAAEAAAKMEDSMAELRTMAPEDAHAFYQQVVSDTLTGDMTTDASLLQGFARTLPATMRRQAKEHYVWRQEQASAAESRSLLAAADLVQKRGGTDTQTEDEAATDAVSFIAGMRPAEGRNIASWQAARTTDLLQLAQGGKFHALSIIKQSGMLEVLSPEQRTKVESAIDTAENRTVSNKSFEYAPDIGRIAGEASVYHTGMTPEATAKELQALNDRFRKETGIDRDLVTLSSGSKIIEDVHQTLLREGTRRANEADAAARAAAADGDKLLAEQKLDQGALASISVGQAAAAARTLGSDRTDRIFLKTWDAVSAQGPQAQASFLQANFTGAGSGDTYTNTALKKQFQTRVDMAMGKPLGEDFFKLADQFEVLNARSPETAAAYFGDKYGRMAAYVSALDPNGTTRGSRNELAAFDYALGENDPVVRKPTTDKDRAAIVQELAGQHDSPFWNIFGPQREPLRDDQGDAAIGSIGTLYSQFAGMPNADSATSVRQAFARRRAEYGDDIVGGYYVPGNRGQTPLVDILRKRQPWESAAGTGDDATDVWDKAVKGKINDLADRYGYDASGPVQVRRYADDGNGVARMGVIFVDENHLPREVRMTSDDIKNFVRSPTGRSVAGRVTVSP